MSEYVAGMRALITARRVGLDELDALELDDGVGDMLPDLRARLAG